VPEPPSLTLAALGVASLVAFAWAGLGPLVALLHVLGVANGIPAGVEDRQNGRLGPHGKVLPGVNDALQIGRKCAVWCAVSGREGFPAMTCLPHVAGPAPASKRHGAPTSWPGRVEPLAWPGEWLPDYLNLSAVSTARKPQRIV